MQGETATQAGERQERERREREQAAIFQLSNIIGACINRITDDPDIIIPAILRVLAVEVITTPGDTTWEFRRANTHRHLRIALADAREIFDKAQAANND